MKIVYKYILLGFGIAVLFSSCRVGKDYTRAELRMPENFKGQTVPLTADTVKLPWKLFFKDKTLIELIEKALEKNNDILVALVNMQQLELSYKQSKTGLLPNIDLGVGANRNWLSKHSLNGSLSNQFISTPYMDDYTATIRVSWEADIWGKSKMQKKGALANYFSQNENFSALKTRIVVQVAQAYYNLIALDEQLKVAQRNVQLSDSTLSMIRLQYRSAQVSALAVAQAEAQKKTAELLLPLTLQDIALQENALSILCGNYPDNVRRSANLGSVVPEEIFPAGVPAALLSRRPDVKAAEYAVISANSRTGLAKAAMYPSLSLTPSVGINSFRFNSWFNIPGSVVKTVAANLTQPIFQGKSLKTAYEIAQLEQQKAVIQFKELVLVAVREVSDAMAKSKYIDERLDLVEQKTASLTKATNDAMLLYKSSMATYLEVITAQNNALQNELEAINIKRDKLNAITELYRALGGGTE